MSETLVLTNARVYTMEWARPAADAIAVQGNRIVAVGAANDMPDGRRIDLGGRTVTPAFTDSHMHIMGWALSLDRIALDGIASVEEIVRLVAEKAAVTPPGEWVLGRGWNHSLWGGTFPSRADLDRVAPNHPVALTRKDGHMVWANTRALELAGVTSVTPNPAGGEIRKDERGEPTGLFAENGDNLIYDAIPLPSSEQRRAALARAFPILHRMGIVGGHEMGYDDGPGLWADFTALRDEGRLPLRVAMYMPKHYLGEMIGRGMRSGDGDHNLRVGGLKIFMDGTLGSVTADMLEPFEGQPNNRGIVTTELDEFRSLAFLGAENGVSVALHAIGDGANRKILDVFSEWRAGRGADSPLRQRIEHVQLLHPDDLGRLAELGVIASMQPIHATSDMLVADKFWGERARYSYAWCSLLSRGTHMAFGSDAPVETPDVLQGIHAAVTRRRADGSPEGGWYPQECVSAPNAVYAYTAGAAYATHEEDAKGTLTPGKLADLVVLSDDIFEVPPMDILNARVDATMLDGQWVYQDHL